MFHLKNFPYIIGHRGASAVEPENTMRAFEQAIKDGASGIEFDIRKTKDDQIVIIHDETVNRTSNGTGKIRELEMTELLKLDFGKGEKIPLLADVLKKYGNDYWLNIEIKESGFEELLVSTIRELDISQKVIISSFNAKSIQKIKKIDKNLTTAYLFAFRRINFGDLKKNLSISGVHPRKNIVNRWFLKKAQKHNLFVNTWTVDNPKRAKHLAKIGIDGIITNNPKKIKKHLKM